MSINLLCQDPLYADLTPIEQDEAEDGGGLVEIMYSLEYSDAIGYFRALSAKEEYSDRALDVTLRVIRLNPAHYTVWQYRFQTLLKLGKSLIDELGLMNELAEENMKSYQVWHHRLLLLTHLFSSSTPSLLTPQIILSELAFISHSLLPDQKNYHTWAYRQFVLSHFSQLLSPSDWAAESSWVDSLLRVESGSKGEEEEEENANEELEGEGESGEWEEVIGGEGEGGEEKHKGDVRNNSAWGHRWFLFFGRVGAPGKEAVEKEIEYTKSQISLVPNNASAWNYLRGIHSHHSLPLSSQSIFVTSLLSSLHSSSPPRDCAQAIEWLGDQKEEEGDLEGARECFEKLKTLDPIRRLFWAHRQSELAVPSSSAQPPSKNSSTAAAGQTV